MGLAGRQPQALMTDGIEFWWTNKTDKQPDSTDTVPGIRKRQGGGSALNLDYH